MGGHVIKFYHFASFKYSGSFPLASSKPVEQKNKKIEFLRWQSNAQNRFSKSLMKVEMTIKNYPQFMESLKQKLELILNY